MLIVAGIALLAVAAYLFREGLRAEFNLRQQKAAGPYETVEAIQIANFGRRLLLVIAGGAGGLCLAWNFAPEAMNESLHLLTAIISHLRR